MAAAMSSSLPATHRRKRIATYGKSSRTPAAFNIHDEAPSPERPRKQVGGGGLLNAPQNRSPSTAGPSRSSLLPPRTSRPKTSEAPDSRSVFDAPSDTDELAPRPAPPIVRQPSAKPTPVRDEFDVPSSDDERTAPIRKLGKATKPLNKIAPTRRLVPAARQATKSKEPPDATSSEDLLASSPPQSETLQSAPKSIVTSRQDGSTAKRPFVKPKSRSRATTPALATALHKRHKSSSSLPSKPLAKQRTAPESDVFNVPSSEEDDALQGVPRKPKPASILRAKTPISSGGAVAQTLSGHHVESDDSATARKRKRQASQATRKVVPTHPTEEQTGNSAVQRGTKYRKKEGSISPGNDGGFELSRAAQKVIAVNGMSEYPINKPRRTKARTIPITLKPPVKNALTSPAKLREMVEAEEAEVLVEDETMYDIPATPPRPNAYTASGSTKSTITPRQKEIFRNLLGDASETITPGIMKFGKLQLSERRIGAGTPSLMKSKSDIAHSASARKPKLIDSLIRAAPAIDEDEDESSDSVESTDPEATEVTPVTRKTHRQAQSTVNIEDEMELDNPQPSSQASQSALNRLGGPKVTYAKQRSYREEANFENELLMSLPTETERPVPRGIGQRRAQPDSDEEDEGTKKIRGFHEQLERGRAWRFKFETEVLIDDLADRSKSGKSKRRTSMMELCQLMADTTVITQLFDTTLVQKLLKNWSSGGEVIFDFAVALAVALIIQTKPGSHVLDQLYQSKVINTLTLLLGFESDIERISKERSTNMSPQGRETVSAIKKLALDSLWPNEKPAKLSPRLLAMKTLDDFVLGLRKSGSSESLLEEDAVSKLIDIAMPPFERFRLGTATADDNEVLGLAFSIMEAVSCLKERPVAWSTGLLRRLVDMIPVFCTARTASPVTLAIRLTMNLTNNKPEACDVFAVATFVQPLVQSIADRFVLLADTSLGENQRMEMLEPLILSLGAMFNLAEYSDAARESVWTEDEALIEALVSTFLEGQKRAAQAESEAEARLNVAFGYLTVLLGNLCLNDTIRQAVRMRLPGQKVDMLLDAVGEFIHYNEKVDEIKDQFEGEEGKETYANFTGRLRLVVERVRKASG